MSDTEPDIAEPVEGEEHVPTDLVELHEVLEWERAVEEAG